MLSKTFMLLAVPSLAVIAPALAAVVVLAVLTIALCLVTVIALTAVFSRRAERRKDAYKVLLVLLRYFFQRQKR
ncbi:hypothetical protein [Streptomyces scopuliridis]|uniref:hypothetical protein n=1 Tax=Streptomyces scopuliridis TaxID=452529 RepID=UPI0036894D27